MSTHSSSPQPAVDLDKEAGAGNRPLSGVYLQLATVLAIAISAYAIYANALSNTQEFYRNTTFLSGILIPGFIPVPLLGPVCHPQLQPLGLSVHHPDAGQLRLFLR